MSGMTAVFLTDKAKIELREAPKPVPGQGEVLVRVRACGICGSDLHFYHGRLPSRADISPGHEFAGDIAELGEGVDGFQEGDRVAVEPYKFCRECSYCRAGHYLECSERVAIGALVSLSGSGVDICSGALTEYIVVPSYTLYRLPDELDFVLGALMEPLAAAVHGVHLAEVSEGETVCVLGSGTIGLMSILAARAAGATNVIASYRHAHQAAAALAVGASRVVKSEEIDDLGPEQIDVVIETVGGAAQTPTQALGLIGPRGRVLLLGLFTQPVQLNVQRVMTEQARIIGGNAYCRRPGQPTDYDAALTIVRAEADRAGAIITHRFPLDQTAEAFATAADKSTGSIKVQVCP
ncbi:MAG: alcohol dehydrogenase catalytic domain-containing protein [Chloroflexi bacterium]|nr:alcohol dehydrogenase catalytic domain-containing protein [Chloroflexota bacterium]